MHYILGVTESYPVSAILNLYEEGIFIMKIIKRTDLDNKNCAIEEYQAQFCDRLRVRILLPTQRLGR